MNIETETATPKTIETPAPAPLKVVEKTAVEISGENMGDKVFDIIYAKTGMDLKTRLELAEEKTRELKMNITFDLKDNGTVLVEMEDFVKPKEFTETLKSAINKALQEKNLKKDAMYQVIKMEVVYIIEDEGRVLKNIIK